MRMIPLTKGKFALVDDEDFERLSQWKWMCSSKGYAVRDQYLGKVDGKYKDVTICMHREILNAPKGMDVDHKNGNRLDNRRSNIRVCTRSQNMANKTSVERKVNQLPMGVCKNYNKKSKKPYIVRIFKEKKLEFLGYFDDLDEATRAYKENKKLIYGEFAP